MRPHYAGLFFFGLFLTGCTEHVPEPGNSRIQNKPPRPIQLLSTSLLSETGRSVLESERSYSIERILFPDFSVKYWKPAGKTRRPAVLLLPAIWGDRTIERFAQSLALEGFACLQVSSRNYLDRINSMDRKDLENLAETIILQTTEAKQLLDWLAVQPDVDTERIGLLGISIGAIIGGLLTEADDRIRSSVLLLGGGNLPEILAAPQGYVKNRLRNEIMSENGMAPEEFAEEAARALYGIDPLTHAGRLDYRRVFLINGRFDRVIPIKNAREYWEALGRPQWLVIPAGHYTASFFISYLQARVVDYLTIQFAR